MSEDTTITRDVVVDGTVEQAFTAFAGRFDAIKPREHNLLDSPVVSTTMEPTAGGRITDRAADGSECTWARILTFEPPHRIVFTWDISPTWTLETDPAYCSEVEVRFIAEDTHRTRVELEHRHLDRHGPGWPSLRDGIGGDQGWPVYLTRYAAVMEHA